MCVGTFGRIHNAANEQRRGAAAAHRLPVNSQHRSVEKNICVKGPWLVDRCEPAL